jgi:glycosyltransferase involved in cell wall biosynthesis
VLQAYQTAPQIERLLAGDQAKLDCAWFCHALVTSEHFDREKLSRLFGRTPVRVCNVGPRIDVEWLNRASAGVPPAAVNSNSEPLEWDSQFVVGGGGTSGEHAAFFTSLARECPDVAFVWLGETHNANNASIDAPKNLYGAVHRGDILVCLASLGAYVMCGPDGNPLMPTAAAAMGKPVIGFPTAGATELLGHYGILCHGNPDPAPVSDIIRKIAAQTPLAPVHTNDWLGRQLDVDGCVNTILQTMADVRLMELR